MRHFLRSDMLWARAGWMLNDYDCPRIPVRGSRCARSIEGRTVLVSLSGWHVVVLDSAALLTDTIAGVNAELGIEISYPLGRCSNDEI